MGHGIELQGMQANEYFNGKGQMGEYPLPETERHLVHNGEVYNKVKVSSFHSKTEKKVRVKKRRF